MRELVYLLLGLVLGAIIVKLFEDRGTILLRDETGNIVGILPMKDKFIGEVVKKEDVKQVVEPYTPIATVVR